MADQTTGKPGPRAFEGDDRELRRDIDRWLVDGMTDDQYDALRAHIARIREQAATEARRELLATLRTKVGDWMATAMLRESDQADGESEAFDIVLEELDRLIEEGVK